MTPTLVASRTALPPEGALAPGGGPAALVPAERQFGVGIIGVGNMGAAMAERLARLGWQPWVYDIIPAKAQNLERFGAVALVDTTHIAIETVAIVICVVDAAQTREVLFGAQGIALQLRPGQVVVLCPTISPQDVGDIAQRLHELGVGVLDCPMSGGPVRAREGTMSLMVAGADAAFETCSDLLKAIADAPSTSSTPSAAASTSLLVRRPRINLQSSAPSITPTTTSPSMTSNIAALPFANGAMATHATHRKPCSQ